MGITEQELLLTPYELSQLKGNEWVNGRWYYDPYEIMRAQIVKVKEALPELAKEAGYKKPVDIPDYELVSGQSGR